MKPGVYNHWGYAIPATRLDTRVGTVWVTGVLARSTLEELQAEWNRPIQVGPLEFYREMTGELRGECYCYWKTQTSNARTIGLYESLKGWSHSKFQAGPVTQEVPVFSTPREALHNWATNIESAWAPQFRHTMAFLSEISSFMEPI